MKKIYYIIALVLLVSMMYYSYTAHSRYYPSISDFVKDPEKYDNVLTEQQVQVYNITPDSFMTRFGNDEVLVKYPNLKRPKYGQVTFLGYYKKEGFIQATAIRYSNYNYGKYVFSFIGLFILLFIFFREWKITSRGFKDAGLD